MDGIDGCGKTTQVQMLCQRLREQGRAIIASREPTGGLWGQRLRQSAIDGRLEPEEELEIILNDRRDDVESCIRPALAADAIVILDRYYTSTLAYQTLRGLDSDTILARNLEFAPVPDLIFLLEVDPRVALKRIESRSGGADLFETEHHLRQVATQFASLDLPNLIRLNAELPVTLIHERIYDETCRKFDLIPDEHS